MTVETFEGVVENGQVRLPSSVRLPERARVYVVVPQAKPVPASIYSPRLVNPEQATEFTKQVIEVTGDAGLR
jgi:hypothetical protein